MASVAKRTVSVKTFPQYKKYTPARAAELLARIETLTAVEKMLDTQGHTAASIEVTKEIGKAWKAYEALVHAPETYRRITRRAYYWQNKYNPGF